ncbi:SDR family oxidoreductase [Streptomyces sp. NPDC057238]|uniref:SDR family oxidoreductase n=1 Tax=Streptomyces sp. NPDC057238 TaxID=3346060 RepID=UPI003638EFED
MPGRSLLAIWTVCSPGASSCHFIHSSVICFTVRAFIVFLSSVLPLSVSSGTGLVFGGRAVHLALTGATGFLGSRLLLRLLLLGNEVTVLARSGPGDVRERLTLALTAMGTPREAAESLMRRQVRAVTIELSEPWLGLSTTGFTELANSLDAVWHCAGDIRLDGDLATLRVVNVEGTRRMLELADAARRRPFLYHVSTAYVAGCRREGVVREDDLSAEHGFESAYEQSKYEAECLVRAWAAERRRPAVVFRPGILLSDQPVRPGIPRHPLQYALQLARTVMVGALGMDDGAGRLRLRALGREDAMVNLLPVEWAAEAMTTLAERSPAQGAVTYHIVHPQDTPVQVMTSVFESVLGVQLDLVPAVREPNVLEQEFPRHRGFTAYLAYRRRFDDTMARRLLGPFPSPADVDANYLLRGLRTADPTPPALAPPGRDPDPLHSGSFR